ncbi:MAG TPA: methyltransferase domain-containing protein [Propionibacteriaceae bacterium]|nr:methyltransferase domain-containing protein [Propionibacteriaceae bacterium]
MTDSHPGRVRVAALFDDLAPRYDQGPVPWFRPIAARLVDLLDPQPGDRALDVGAGRGAATFPLAEAVGATGRVVAVDLSPRMCDLLRTSVADAGAAQVEVVVGEARPGTRGGSEFDVVAASLVLFFDPEPAATLSDWMRLLRPGGRIGLTTFGPVDDAWTAAERRVLAHAPADMLDARTSGTRGVFGSPSAMAGLLEQCGAIEVGSHDEPLEVTLPDAGAWRAWTMTLGMRQIWDSIPPPRREEVFTAAATELEGARGADGRLHLTQQVRYTIGRAP